MDETGLFWAYAVFFILHLLNSVSSYFEQNATRSGPHESTDVKYKGKQKAAHLCIYDECQ
jgi:hypothetical protein